MKAIGRTDRGKIRESNQDHYAIIRGKKALLAVVCDGIGGHIGGGKASDIIIQYLKHHFDRSVSFESSDHAMTYIKELIIDANDHLFDRSKHDPLYKGMGTTLVALMITKEHAILVNVGDSRCYGIHNDELSLLSDDHSYVNEMMKLGKLTPHQAQMHPYRNMLTNAMGITDQLVVDVSEITQKHDAYLLCSDGLHGYVSYQQISDVVISNMSATKKVTTLIQLANDAGGFDNVTIIYLTDLQGETS